MANPQLTPEEEAAIINGYWSGPSYSAGPPAAAPPPPAAPAPAAPATLPYQPNPGAPGYNPNPGATPDTPATPQGALLGAPATGPRPTPPNPHPLFQNPFNQTAIDMGEVDAPAPDLAPPVPAGPSAADDAAFAQFRAKQDADSTAKEKKIASYYASGSPAKANPDPYGIAAAQQGQVDALGARMHAMGRAADADAVKAVQIAEGQRDLGRMQQEDAAIDRAQAELAQRHFDDGMQEIGRQLDDVRAAKIDPLRKMKEEPALAVSAIVGGMIGGFYQGITGGQRNEFLADIDRQLDRAYEEDVRQLGDKKFALGQAQNLLGEQRAVQKDADLARLQSRNLQYEAIKQQIDAQATEDGTPAARARADDGIAQMQGQQQALIEEIGRRKKAQADAAGAAGMAQAKEVRDFRYKVYEKMIGEGFSPAQAEAEARRQVAIQYLGGVGPRPPGGDMSQPPMTREQRGKLAAEHGEADRSTAEFNTQIDALKKNPVIHSAGLTTGPLAALGGRIAPDSAHEHQEINNINMQLLAAVGKMAKDADGKPNKHVLQEIKETYFLTDGEPPEMKLQKLEGARSYVNALARQQGATGAPAPNRQSTLSSELGAKPIR